MVQQESSSTRPIVDCLCMPLELADRLRIELQHQNWEMVSHQSPETLLSQPSEQRYGCAVIYNWSDGRESLELIHRLRALKVPTQIVLVVVEAVATIIARAAHGGATDVLQANQPAAELRDAIANAIEIDRVERPRAIESLQQRERLESLSEGERDVLRLVLDGLPNKVIAARLDVSQRTVEARRHKLFLKTGTTSIAELVRMVVQLGG